MAEEVAASDAPDRPRSWWLRHGDIVLAVGGILTTLWNCGMFYALHADRKDLQWLFVPMPCCCECALLPMACLVIPVRCVLAMVRSDLRVTWAGFATRLLLFAAVLVLMYGEWVMYPTIAARCGDAGTRELIERTISFEELQTWVVRVNEDNPGVDFLYLDMFEKGEAGPPPPKGLSEIARPTDGRRSMDVTLWRRSPPSRRAKEPLVLKIETGSGFGHWGV